MYRRASGPGGNVTCTVGRLDQEVTIHVTALDALTLHVTALDAPTLYVKLVHYITLHSA